MRLEKSCLRASCLIQGSAPTDAVCDSHLCPAQARCPQCGRAQTQCPASSCSAPSVGKAPSSLRPDFCPLLVQEELVNNTELVQSYRQQIGSVVNQFNLQLFLNMYNR